MRAAPKARVSQKPFLAAWPFRLDRLKKFKEKVQKNAKRLNARHRKQLLFMLDDYHLAV